MKGARRLAHGRPSINLTGVLLADIHSLAKREACGVPNQFYYKQEQPSTFNTSNRGKMRPRTIALLFTWLACAVTPPRACAGQATRDADSDRRAVIQLEKQWLRAESGDSAALNRILAEDFVHPVPQGMFLTKRQQIAWTVGHPRPANRVARFSRLDVRLFRDVAIVTGIVDNVDTSGADRRRSMFTDVFVRRDGRWQAVNAQENALPG